MRPEQAGTRQTQKFLSEELELQQAVRKEAELQFETRREQRRLLEEPKLGQPGMEEVE
jgi:hypothetical protein